MKQLSQLMSVGLFTFSLNLNAAAITVINAGFEDVSGQSTFNEFTFGIPVGWNLYDPNNITSTSGVFTGTLQPNGVDFFSETAPEGDRVAILFNSGALGAGEYGISQTLGDTLTANTHYELSVDIGDINSGFAQNGTFFDLEEFPGYRIDLLAGGQVIAQDNNLLAGSLIEGVFSTATLSFSVADNHALLGQSLGIRLVNLNQIPAGFNTNNSPDLEVDFDNIQLRTTALPLPPSLLLFLSAGLTFFGWSFSVKTRNRPAHDNNLPPAL